MKLNYIKLAAIAVPVLGFTACMDFDTPSDEFTSNQQTTDDKVYVGHPDSIPYTFVAEPDSVEEAIGTFMMGGNFSQMLTAEYYMRGGKDGSMPGPHAYQYQYNLHIDNYAGYFVADQNFDGRLVTTYSYYREFHDGPYGHYKEVRNHLCNTLNHPMIDRLPEIKAIGLLLFNYISQEQVDIYGSVPYTDMKNNKQTAPFTFEPGSEIYRKIVNNIDTIVACFAHFESKPDWYKSQLNGVISYPVDGITHDKQISTWRRMANSLKLRMAMHYVKYDPTTAQKWAEEAVADGVVTEPAHEIVLDMPNGLVSNPILEIAKSWSDTRLNASLESLLASLDHPYMKYVFAPNSEAITNTKTGKVLPANSRVVGLRAGLVMVPGQTPIVNPRCSYSGFKLDDWSVDPATFSAISDAPLYFIKVSEMDFLRAEGALRGWNMQGEPKALYEHGIRHAQLEGRGAAYEYKQYYKDYVDAYMNLENPIDYTYVDPMDDANNHPSVTKIGVKWNDGDPLEVKLEKIITQKYIALYPYANEAWTELRRTGYPKIFPVLNAEDYSDGTYANPDEIIRRIPLPGGGSSEGDADILNSGIPALEFDGGFGDYQYSRIFWDIDRPNF